MKLKVDFAYLKGHRSHCDGFKTMLSINVIIYHYGDASEHGCPLEAAWDILNNRLENLDALCNDGVVLRSAEKAVK